MCLCRLIHYSSYNSNKICKYGRQVKMEALQSAISNGSLNHKPTIKITMESVQYYLFGNFLQMTIKVSVSESEFLFSMTSSFHYFLLNKIRWLSLSYTSYFILFWTIRQKGLIAITFDGNKNESCKCYLGNKEQRIMFLVVS